MKNWKPMLIGLSAHIAIWTYPIAPAGLDNILLFFVWAMAILGVFLAFISLRFDLRDTSDEQTAILKYTLRASFWLGMTWLVYHGLFALPAVFIFGSFIAFLGRKIHE